MITTLCAVAALAAVLVLAFEVDALRRRLADQVQFRADDVEDTTAARIQATAASRDAALAVAKVDALVRVTLDTTCDLDVPEVDGPQVLWQPLGRMSTDGVRLDDDSTAGRHAAQHYEDLDPLNTHVEDTDHA
jgi:hypothetical protein